MDDSDVTLSICVGEAGGWTGGDLIYAVDNARPDTPDLQDSQTHMVTHVHQPGVGVFHTGTAYHMVSPMQSGERFSLVSMAFYDDAEWKRDYYTTHQSSH